MASERSRREFAGEGGEGALAAQHGTESGHDDHGEQAGRGIGQRLWPAKLRQRAARCEQAAEGAHRQGAGPLAGAASSNGAHAAGSSAARSSGQAPLTSAFTQSCFGRSCG